MEAPYTRFKSRFLRTRIAQAERAKVKPRGSSFAYERLLEIMMRVLNTIAGEIACIILEYAVFVLNDVKQFKFV